MAEQIVTAPVEYRDVDGFPSYRVGSDGSIWSRLRNRGSRLRTLDGQWHQLTPVQLKTGYQKISIYRDGKKCHSFMHGLIASTFHGPCPDGHQCCHNNGIRNDNRPSNLRWDSKSANQRDREKHGTQCLGENNKNSKLTELEVREILVELAAGASQRGIARRRGLDHGTIGMIARRETWRHVAIA